eukprot:TRINITY_DN9483_c0_g1_i1.p1 TRINITY_DN9483_c0_g1~~TRINITY_DN9483_c0_g1_i1.p1  ORF type:complete len:973 (-),score=172.16 TRINITY_DN9483_c0_g1_i1:274-3147(-)
MSSGPAAADAGDVNVPRKRLKISGGGGAPGPEQAIGTGTAAAGEAGTAAAAPGKRWVRRLRVVGTKGDTPAPGSDSRAPAASSNDLATGGVPGLPKAPPAVANEQAVPPEATAAPALAAGLGGQPHAAAAAPSSGTVGTATRLQAVSLPAQGVAVAEQPKAAAPPSNGIATRARSTQQAAPRGREAMPSAASPRQAEPQAVTPRASLQHAAQGASTRRSVAEPAHSLHNMPSATGIQFLPATSGGGCPVPQVDQQQASADLSKLRLRQDHWKRPLWVCPDGRIVFEAFHQKATQVEDFLISIAEPVSRPDFMHEYQMTMLSLNAAVSTGAGVEDIVQVLERLSKNYVDETLLKSIEEQGRTFGQLRLILRNGRHFLEAADAGLLRSLCSDEDISASLVGEIPSQPDANGCWSVEVDSLKTENVKGTAHRLKLPLHQEYEYKQDKTEKNPPLGAILRATTSLRPYQQRGLSKMFSMDGVAKSGIIVLPCGAGKTMVGIAAAIRVGRRVLVLTTTAVSVDQWRRSFIQFTTVPPEDVYTFTADNKTPIADAERRACVLISTYSMLGFGGQRSGLTELVMNQVSQLEWGLMVVDEVQVMPAKTFRTVATTVKSHCILGLTATLVREDDLIFDLHWLIGPKLYEASWQQLQDDGYLSRVRCVEVWCEMSRAFFQEYLNAQADKTYHLRQALWTCNPNKLKVCEYLIRFHEQRGDKIIVFSDNVFILEEFAKKIGRYYICGKVAMSERMQILTAFKQSATCNTIFLSKVGDNAIDIPNASVIIQISSHFGSRRQEAQRLGRILRPKPQQGDKATTKFNAFFYSLVSRDTQEMYYASRRQQFLVEHGYNYHVLRDESVDRLDSADLVYSSEDAQLALLKLVLESVHRGEDMEKDDEEVALSVPGTRAKAAKAEKVKEELPATVVKAERSDDRVMSLASLSGGLEGSYAVRNAQSGLKVKKAEP